jgi:acetyl esterase/lipase
MARSHKELSDFNIIDPEFKEHVSKRPVKLPPSFPDVEIARLKRRAHLDALVPFMPIPGPIPEQVEEHEVFVAAQDGFHIPITVYAPAAATTGDLPVIILMHEGGWHLGDRKDEEMNARIFVKDLNCVAINVEYRLGPEHPFPTGVLDCYSTLQELCREPKTFHHRADPSKGIVLGGSSAGGNLAAVLAHKAREDRLSPPVTGQWLSVAALIPEYVCPKKYRPEYVSGTENQDDPVIGKLPPGSFKGESSYIIAHVAK